MIAVAMYLLYSPRVVSQVARYPDDIHVRIPLEGGGPIGSDCFLISMFVSRERRWSYLSTQFAFKLCQVSLLA